MSEVPASLRKRGECSKRLSDAGDTLIEVLFAILVLGVSSAAIFAAFSTSLASAGAHKGQSTLQGLLSNYAQTVVAQVEFGTPPKYRSCATPNYYKTNLDFTSFNQKLAQLNATTQTPYVLELTDVQFWNGSSFGPSCAAGSMLPQLMVVYGVGPNGAKSSLTFSAQNLDFNGPTPVTPTLSASPAASYPVGKFSLIPIHFTGAPLPVLTCTRVDRSAPCQTSLDGDIAFDAGATSTNATGYLIISSKTPAGTYKFLIEATNGFPTPSEKPSKAITVVVQ
jgi:type II secretory pathway pseudopilin PulG